MATRERTLSDFLRQPREILLEIERGEVILKRRDGDDLVVLAREHWEKLRESVLFLTDAYRGLPGQRLSSEDHQSWSTLPWLALLHDEDRESCLEDLVKATVAALELGRTADLVETIAQWRATALATWDDDRRRDNPGYREDAPRPLPRP